MDPVTIGALAATALGIVAQTALKGTIDAVVKDAYTALKEKIASWAGADVEALVTEPSSRARHAVIAEAIDARPEREQEDVKALANRVFEALKQAPPPTRMVSADRGAVAVGGNISGSTITTQSTGAS
jgi:hypothetical protein